MCIRRIRPSFNIFVPLELRRRVRFPFLMQGHPWPTLPAGTRTTVGDPWLCKLQRNKHKLPVHTPSPNTQGFLVLQISPLQSEGKQYIFLIVPLEYYWPLLHVCHFLYSSNKKVTGQTICFQTCVKFLRRLQNPARFALSRDAVSGDFYWLTSYAFNQGCIHAQYRATAPLRANWLTATESKVRLS